MYEDSGVSFITDLTDSLNNYVASHSDGEKPKKTMTTVTNQLINAVGRDGAVMILQGEFIDRSLKGKCEIKIMVF